MRATTPSGSNWLILLAALSSCAGHLSNGVYSKSETDYRVAAPGPGWSPVGLKDNDLAYVANGSGHSLAVNSTCKDFDDPPLAVLTRHLLMGFTERETLGQEQVVLDGRDGLRSHVTARLDGVPVELLLLVMKKDGCVYDFTYLSPPGHLAERQPDFERLLASFHVERAP